MFRLLFVYYYVYQYYHYLAHRITVIVYIKISLNFLITILIGSFCWSVYFLNIFTVFAGYDLEDLIYVRSLFLLHKITTVYYKISYIYLKFRKVLFATTFLVSLTFIYDVIN